MFTNAEVLAAIGDRLIAEKDSYDAGHGRDAGPGMVGKLVDKFGIAEETAANLVCHYRKDTLFGRVGSTNAAIIARALAEQPAALAHLKARRKKYANAPRTPQPQPKPLTAAESSAYMETLRGKIADLRTIAAQSDAAEAELSPWELAQRQRERADDLFENCAHESKHITTGLACGARVRHVSANAIEGLAQFENIPPEHDLAISAAGTCWSDRRIWEHVGRDDKRYVDAAILRADSSAKRGTERYHVLLEAALARVDAILESEHAFYAACRDALIERGKLSGSEVHSLWNRLRRD